MAIFKKSEGKIDAIYTNNKRIDVVPIKKVSNKKKKSKIELEEEIETKKKKGELSNGN